MHRNIRQANTYMKLNQVLTQIPFIIKIVMTKGWHYIFAWVHRITGLILVMYLILHIYSLNLLNNTEMYDEKMIQYSSFIFRIFEWALSIPVIYHALNGGRLILYESYGCRNDDKMVRWMLMLICIYTIVVGILSAMGNQNVSPFLFWFIILVLGVTVAYNLIEKMKNTKHSVYWKYQRISGMFLLIMIPAHLIFMHLNPSISKEAQQVIDRMGSPFIKLVDLSLMIAVFYHAIYGMISILQDYIDQGKLKTTVMIMIVLVMLVFASIGVKNLMVI